MWLVSWPTVFEWNKFWIFLKFDYKLLKLQPLDTYIFFLPIQTRQNMIFTQKNPTVNLQSRNIRQQGRKLKEFSGDLNDAKMYFQSSQINAF